MIILYLSKYIRAAFIMNNPSAKNFFLLYEATAAWL
jgi:hypothetical protein